MEATVPLLDITSANASMVMIVEDLYPAGVPITNFSTDHGRGRRHGCGLRS